MASTPAKAAPPEPAPRPRPSRGGLDPVPRRGRLPGAGPGDLRQGRPRSVLQRHGRRGREQGRRAGRLARRRPALRVRPLRLVVGGPRGLGRAPALRAGGAVGDPQPPLARGGARRLRGPPGREQHPGGAAPAQHEGGASPRAGRRARGRSSRGPPLAGLGFTGATLVLVALVAVRVQRLLRALVDPPLGEGRRRRGVGRRRRSAAGIEARRDREAGLVAAQAREEKVEEAKRIFEEHEPIRIALPGAGDPEERARGEGKAGAALRGPARTRRCRPSRSWTRPTATSSGPTPETLEYTSRLIERKLLDFNVQVKVVAAYPGPGHHALRGRARGGREGRAGREPRPRPRARALGHLDPRGRDDPRHLLHGPGDPERQARDRAPVRDHRLAGLRRHAFAPHDRDGQGHHRQARRRRPRSACRTCWWRERPARASRWPSTR